MVSDRVPKMGGSGLDSSALGAVDVAREELEADDAVPKQRLAAVEP